MCLGGGGSPAPVTPAPAPAAPTRESVAADAAAGKIDSVEKIRKKVRQRQGIFANIRTTPAGDPLYGQNVGSLAAFGAA